MKIGTGTRTLRKIFPNRTTLMLHCIKIEKLSELVEIVEITLELAPHLLHENGGNDVVEITSELAAHPLRKWGTSVQTWPPHPRWKWWK